MTVRSWVLVGLTMASITTGPATAAGPSASTRLMSGACLPTNTARGARIVALGAYEGGAPSPFALVEGGHETSAIAVSAARRGPPLVLVLSAYDPVVWDLQAFPASRLRAVLVYGYHGQAVAGVSPRTPIRFITGVGGEGLCGTSSFAYKGGRELDALDASVTKATGRGIDAFQGKYATSAFNVDQGPVAAPQLQQLRLADLRTSDPFEAGQLAGQRGIDALMAAGVIRPATATDFQALDTALTRASRTGHLAPVRASRESDRAYVVLRPMTVPRGMYGAHSATFLIPAGVPRPTDRGSHNVYISLVNGARTGR